MEGREAITRRSGFSPWQEGLTGAGDKRRTCRQPCAPLSGSALAGPAWAETLLRARLPAVAGPSAGSGRGRGRRPGGPPGQGSGLPLEYRSGIIHLMSKLEFSASVRRGTETQSSSDGVGGRAPQSPAWPLATRGEEGTARAGWDGPGGARPSQPAWTLRSRSF